MFHAELLTEMRTEPNAMQHIPSMHSETLNRRYCPARVFEAILPIIL